jgi:hypothetical protein
LGWTLALFVNPEKPQLSPRLAASFIKNGWRSNRLKAQALFAAPHDATTG